MKKSAGILLYRFVHLKPEVFLVHPGGPFWKNKDDGAWSIPKGEFTDEEDALTAANRELKEETGIICTGNFTELTPIKQKSGKLIFAWAVEQNANADLIRSNTFKMKWPPKSGKMIDVPEVDRAAWFNTKDAKRKIIPGQMGFIDELQQTLFRS